MFVARGMRVLCLLFVFFILLCSLKGAPVFAADSIPFKSLQWRARTLVITGDRSDPFVVEQLAEFRNHIEDLRARDLAVIRFEGDAIFEFSALSAFNYRGRYNMNANQQRYLEAEMKSDNNIFSVVLFGKDGLFKKIWRGQEGIVPISVLNREIDSMPMRQRGSQK